MFCRKMVSSFLVPSLFGMLLLVGCGSQYRESRQTGSLEGVVFLGNDPLKDVTLSFFSASTGDGVQAHTDESGHYDVARLPVGDYTVRVIPKAVVPPGNPGAPPTVPSDSKIPKKFQESSTSGLTVTIKFGANTSNFRLE
ncbi:hypothetical protein SH661x_003009 [Planctomicrobium sp. SH661]|uniref:hypothetical protein n=1 Tax=Planctomicrobium sp. SH661 TaxID=3448124 RepID=UPI003F5CB71D